MQRNKTSVSKSYDNNLVANGTSSLHSENLITAPFKDAKNNSKNPIYYWGLLASVVVGALISFGSMANNATDKLGELNLTAKDGADQNSTPTNLGVPLSNGEQTPEGEWSAYGGTDYGQRYSPLTQITTDNVKDLELAWQIQTGDVKGPNDIGRSEEHTSELQSRENL